MEVLGNGGEMVSPREDDIWRRRVAEENMVRVLSLLILTPTPIPLLLRKKKKKKKKKKGCMRKKKRVRRR